MNFIKRERVKASYRENLKLLDKLTFWSFPMLFLMPLIILPGKCCDWQVKMDFHHNICLTYQGEMILFTFSICPFFWHKKNWVNKERILNFTFFLLFCLHLIHLFFHWIKISIFCYLERKEVCRLKIIPQKHRKFIKNSQLLYLRGVWNDTNGSKKNPFFRRPKCSKSGLSRNM